jgi:glycosyltransferase involved in cell wall biosynthesis
MKKILFISYHFPPDNAVGALRIVRFSRYLPSFGWEPLVLTLKDRYRDRLGAGMKDVEHVTVVQTITLPRMKDIYLRIRDIGSGLFRGKNRIQPKEAHIFFQQKTDEQKNETFFQKVKRYGISLFIFLPDQSKNWVIPALLRAVYEIKRKKIECAFTSGPPHSVHLIGLLAKKMTGTAWVADFRDPWIDSLHDRPASTRSALSDRIERWMEKQVIRNADKVLTTTKALREVFLKKYPMVSRDKFIYVPNGIDRDKIPLEPPSEKYPKYTITYAGTLYEGRSPVPVFEAIRNLIAQGRIGPDEICLKLVGNCDLIDGRATADVVEEYGLQNVVEVSGHVPYDKAIQVMRNSHLLLLIVPSNHDLCIPAKVYDYFGVEAKILAVTEYGATFDLINETGAGRCFSPGDIDGISECLYEFMKNGNQESSKLDPSRYRQFDAKQITQRLAEALSAVTDH